MPNAKGKNKGEWSEIYVFFKLLTDRRIYVADEKMNKLKDAFLDIISIIREEKTGFEYRYYTGESVRIKLNGIEVKSVDSCRFAENAALLWGLITSNTSTTFDSQEIKDFLHSIFVNSITSPPQKKTAYFGGTEDIVLDTRDYRSGVNRIMGFSCKSDIDAASTLFNASKDNTNFVYKLTGNMSDQVMDEFNSKFNKVIKNGKTCYEVAIGKRMTYLKSCGVDMEFVGTAKPISNRNLINCGGLEMPAIVGGLLKYFYYEQAASNRKPSIDDAVKYITDLDIAGYGFEKPYDIYRSKTINLLYSMFTGLRFGKVWNGRSDVNGGYIVVKRDGDVVAFHSCIADEFKNFLYDKLSFEAPSCKRHDYMRVYKDDSGNYLLKLALQLRFKLKKR